MVPLNQLKSTGTIKTVLDPDNPKINFPKHFSTTTKLE